VLYLKSFTTCCSLSPTIQLWFSRIVFFPFNRSLEISICFSSGETNSINVLIKEISSIKQTFWYIFPSRENFFLLQTFHLISILSLFDGKTDIMHPSLRCIFVCWELSISEEECSLFVCVESCRSVRKNCSLFLCVESCRSVRKSCSLFVCVESCRSVRKSCSLFLCLESCRSVRKSCSLLDVHLIKTKEYWG
jgi:hypothetical protein